MVSGASLPPLCAGHGPLALGHGAVLGRCAPLPQSPHGIPARSSGSPKFAMKTRQAFYLHTTKLTRIARRLCREILRPWHAARHPYMPINSAAIKAECELLLTSLWVGVGRRLQDLALGQQRLGPGRAARLGHR